MTYDPNDRREPEDRRLDLDAAPEMRTGSAWAPWAVLVAVVLVGAFIWSQMSGPGTDPTTTSSTTPPAVTDQAPAPVPMTPAPQATNDTAPATPPAGGTQRP